MAILYSGKGTMLSDRNRFKGATKTHRAEENLLAAVHKFKNIQVRTAATAPRPENNIALKKNSRRLI
jgi:hypothetical protein